MPKQFWLSLPVKNVQRSVEFFTKMGFAFNPQYPVTETGACLLMGEKNVVVMLFDEPAFKRYTGIAEYKISKTPEVLLSIDAATKEEVDEIAQRAIEAGGSSDHKPSEMTGWMYGCLFNDIDGHKWNALYMDMSKMKP